MQPNSWDLVGKQVNKRDRMELIRCFVALELPPTVLNLLADLQTQLRRRGPTLPIRWTNPEGTHLTLKFLGNVDPAKIEEIQRVLDQTSPRTSYLELRLEGLGAFPNPKRARVLWVGMKGDLEGLHNLQREIEDRLVELGFPRERGFVPHLTLGRVKDNIRDTERGAIQQLLEGWGEFHSDPFLVDKVSLMRSLLTPAGAQYTRLHAAPFSKPNQN